jgi:hypothetical protein
MLQPVEVQRAKPWLRALLGISTATESLEIRSHFFAVAAQIMRRILVDYARSRGYDKRGGRAVHVSLDEVAVVCPEPSAD